MYAPAALAFVVVYKASRMMNFALGEWLMLGSRLVATGVHGLGVGLVAAVGGRSAAGRSYADDRVCLGERARSLARFGVEKKPGNCLVDRRRHARLYRADHLTTVEIFPGRSSIVLADGLIL